MYSDMYSQYLYSAGDKLSRMVRGQKLCCGWSWQCSYSLLHAQELIHRTVEAIVNPAVQYIEWSRNDFQAGSQLYTTMRFPFVANRQYRKLVESYSLGIAVFIQDKGCFNS